MLVVAGFAVGPGVVVVLVGGVRDEFDVGDGCAADDGSSCDGVGGLGDAGLGFAPAHVGGIEGAFRAPAKRKGLPTPFSFFHFDPIFIAPGDLTNEDANDPDDHLRRRLGLSNDDKG
jgi:hypothetical protein